MTTATRVCPFHISEARRHSSVVAGYHFSFNIVPDRGKKGGRGLMPVVVSNL
jgi:hypothetical protein